MQQTPLQPLQFPLLFLICLLIYSLLKQYKNLFLNELLNGSINFMNGNTTRTKNKVIVPSKTKKGR